MRALVIEDDAKLSDILVHILERDGFTADAVFDGDAGVEYARSGLYDIILLDVMLPRSDGFTAIRRMRAQGVTAPVLMLTALGAVPDKIEGLDGGADAYMTKPFSPHELRARIRALLRRPGEPPAKEMRAGDVLFDGAAYELRCGPEKVGVSDQEAAVAELFLRNPDRTLTRAQIAAGAWSADAQVEDNSIDAYVSMLRKKLRYLGSATSIETERGVGYRLSTAGARRP